jgi:hypothetical protein
VLERDYPLPLYKAGNMGSGDRVQAILVGVSAGLGAFGTAAAAIPDFVPPEYKVPIAVTSWLAGIVDFSIKEALGGQAPLQNSSYNLVKIYG